tara:strand:- start:833 stop:1567 length:735 start_codon:yes stop_codon:yes gene_type:complete
MTKTLLVTGGGRGIGAETCLRAAKDGWDICVNYINNAERANEVVSLVEQAGRRAIAVQADISIESDVKRLFEACDYQLAPLKGLVNSAGILEPITRIEAISGDELVRHVMVNVVGTVLCAREGVKRMSTTSGGNGGVIVNISSRASTLGGAGAHVHYAASKGAVDSFTFGLSQEVGAEGVRVCAVSPGTIDTEIQPEGRIETIAPTIPFKRVGEAREVANAIVWLLSDEAEYVSGTVLGVSGGR